MNSNWVKSSFSMKTACLEARWKKSSASGAMGCVEARWQAASECTHGNCVEARRDRGLVEVRDSKDKDGPVLAFGPAAWLEFLYASRDGTFDLPAR